MADHKKYLEGPLHTDVGEQGGLGGEKVHNPAPKAMYVPDPMGYVKTPGAKGYSAKKKMENYAKKVKKSY